MLKAAIFDMDGVLADTEGFYNQRRAAYLAEAYPSFDGPWDFAGSNDRAIWETIVPDDAALRERLHAGYDAYRAAHPEDYGKLGNPDAPLVFRILRDAGLLIGIASSSEAAMIERMMSAMGLNAMVSAYVSGHDVPRHKPEPDVYFACMQALGVLPTECIVVEDSPTGIAAGKASGAQVVALSQYVVPGTDQTSADRIIERLSELPAIVQGR